MSDGGDTTSDGGEVICGCEATDVSAGPYNRLGSHEKSVSKVWVV